MNRLNFNIKDRKMLYGILVVVLVCVFTLTIAYAALNAVLTIQGTAQVSSADWDIHLANPKVTNGSATTNVPQIKTNSTMDFSTTLNMPGDFYEFTVDVVNGGSIDAMIENVIKNPELDASQKKYLKYEITYQNGESITSKQNIAAGATTPIKVRIEYRNDLTASDLPTSTETLSLALTLVYVQSDGTGSDVLDNGVYDPFKIGNEKCFGSECFYVIGIEGENVKLLSMFNLNVGNSVNSYIATPMASTTGKQHQDMRGWNGEAEDSGENWYGTTAFSNTNSTYVGSIVEGYVNNYKTILESEYGVDVVQARLISYDELTDSETFDCVAYDYCSDKYPWIYSTTYWSGSSRDIADGSGVWGVSSDGSFSFCNYGSDSEMGVRPVIIISKDYFN